MITLVTRPSPSDHLILISKAADHAQIDPEVSGLQMLAGTERGIPSSIFQAPQGSRVWSLRWPFGEGKPTKLFMGPRAPSRISNRFGTHHCVNPPKIRFNPQCSYDYVNFKISHYRNLSDSLWFLFSVWAQPNSNDPLQVLGSILLTCLCGRKGLLGLFECSTTRLQWGSLTGSILRYLGVPGDLPLDIQQKAWSLKGTWNLEKLIWRYLELLWSLFSSCHRDISTIFDISQLRCRDVVSSEFMCPLSTEVVCIAWNSIRTIRILRIGGDPFGFLKNNCIYP